MPEKKKMIYTRLDPTVIKRVKAIAKEQKRSFATMIEILIETALTRPASSFETAGLGKK